MKQFFYKLNYAPYSRRFRIPLKTARGTAETRDGILVTLEDSSGNTARGEIAPWEGFACETLSRAESILRKIAGEAFPADRFYEILSRGETLPCTRHAISAAMFFLKNAQAAHYPEPPSRTVCKLIPRKIDDTPETIFERISCAREFRSVKIKIGLAALSEEIRFCGNVLDFAKKRFPEAQIRFDANGAWNDASVLDAIAPLCRSPQLEFIEQPLAPSPENDARIFALPRQFAEKIALDESVREPWEMPAGTPVIAVVKPLLIGDFPRLRDWLSRHSGAPKFVLSSVFETEIGRNVLRLLCTENADNPRALAAGIGTLQQFP